MKLSKIALSIIVPNLSVTSAKLGGAKEVEKKLEFAVERALALHNNFLHDENVKHATMALKKAMKSHDLSNAVVEEILGSSPDGGRLVRLSARSSKDIETPADKGLNTRNLQKKTKQPKSKSGFKTKKPKAKKTKMPKGSKSTKANKCTKLVAEEASWASWFGSDDNSNFTPIFKPATDAELRTIVESSRKHSCTVRMMGAKHSWDGLVTQRKEEDVVVISLADHVTEIDGWTDSIDPSSSTFRIGAGKSWYDVSALIRPHGYVLNSRSSSAFFSVGGVIANMVHGGGRTAGFMHDDVVKMLVLTSDGNFQEVGGDDLKYWRSSIGQLGMITAIEMKIHSEAIPQVLGIDPSTGEPIINEQNGGFVMKRNRILFGRVARFTQFVQNVVSKAYGTNAMHENSQFFFNYYTNTLSQYYTDFSGPRFSGATGPFPDEAKAAQYRSATESLAADFNVFEGVQKVDFSVDYLCAIFCLPPTGPLGDGSDCTPIPSGSEPGKRLCDVPVETNAAMSMFSGDSLDEFWDQDSLSSNDGYFIMNEISSFDNLVAFIPARSLASAFGTWYGVVSQALTGALGINYAPNSSLEFRFIDPKETAVLNPIPPMFEVKAAFNKENQAFGPDAFDTFFPPLPEGTPDGWIAIELLNIRNVNDDDFEKFAVAMQQAWSMMASNPLLPYGNGVVNKCDALNNILPCQESPATGTQCCNPSVPVFFGHLGKGWGYGVNPSTTPTTGKMTPFTDPIAIENMYNTVPSKQNSIQMFNAKRAEYDADVFSGGAMMRWLDPSVPNTDYEVRKLDGQMCGSPDFMLDPNKECINDRCINSICV